MGSKTAPEEKLVPFVMGPFSVVVSTHTVDLKEKRNVLGVPSFHVEHGWDHRSTSTNFTRMMNPGGHEFWCEFGGGMDGFSFVSRIEVDVDGTSKVLIMAAEA